jgi:cobyrinic acid a,c-diamide synthase
MAGLLPLETSFAERRLHLGYRHAVAANNAAGPLGGRFAGHEFHYASVVREAEEGRLFALTDAEGRALPAAGLRRGRVCGSFVHLIDRQTGDPLA